MNPTTQTVLTAVIIGVSLLVLMLRFAKKAKAGKGCNHGCGCDHKPKAGHDHQH
jgi:multisubunit Na+/H+ antiporter MnhC subunit